MTDFSEFSRAQLLAYIESLESWRSESGADTRIAETEAPYPDFFNSVTDEIHVWKLVRDDFGNIITWSLLDINDAAVKSWGKQREDVIDKTAEEIFSESAKLLFMPIVAKIFRENASHTWETYFPNLGQYLQMTSIPLGEYFISVGVDISDKKKG